MSEDARRRVWDRSPYRGATFSVHLTLAWRVPEESVDDSFDASVRDVAAQSRVSPGAASAALRIMRQDGLLEFAKRVPSGQTPLRYRLLFPPVPPIVPDVPMFIPQPVGGKGALKSRALLAYSHQCVYCERGGTPTFDPDGFSWELDRIVPGACGGEYIATNVALACRTCNNDKRAQLDWAGPTLSLADLEALAKGPS